jgi:inosine-uridine nucleoside N-ribohydrolase/formylmethanofuran dehydrogenase subunit E
MRKLFLILLFFCISANIFCHPFKPHHFIIIDTDAGIDDLRAITMLLAVPDVRVLAITVSPGVLPAEEGYIKVKSLLNTLHHEGVLTGINKLNIKAKNCRDAVDMQWGNEKGVLKNNIPGSLSIIRNVFSHCEDRIDFVCLGSLMPVCLYLDSLPGFFEKISQIIWSNELMTSPKGFNYELSSESFNKVKASHLPFIIINGNSLPGLLYDKSFSESMNNLHSPYADVFSNSFKATNQHMNRWFDEMVAVYLHYPNIFKADTIERVTYYSLNGISSPSALSKMYNKILSTETVNSNQVIEYFPMDTAVYFNDIQPLMLKTVAQYGKAEWISGVIANELHRHLGVFAIIGVKMGARAIDYFSAGIDELKVVSYAGLIPPFSCMNDGLQVSTGATLGHGLISVSPDTLKLPAADFTYLGKTVRISLKPGISKKVAKEVKELNLTYGLNSDIYWEKIRLLAINYWASFNRNEIFDIKGLSSK